MGGAWRRGGSSPLLPPSAPPSVGCSFLPASVARFAIWGRASRPSAPPEHPGSRPRDGGGPGAGEVTAEAAEAEEAGGRGEPLRAPEPAAEEGPWPPGLGLCVQAGPEGRGREELASGREGGLRLGKGEETEMCWKRNAQNTRYQGGKASLRNPQTARPQLEQAEISHRVNSHTRPTSLHVAQLPLLGSEFSFSLLPD